MILVRVERLLWTNITTGEQKKLENFKGYFCFGILKGTLMQTWKSTNIFVFVWKYVEDFTLKTFTFWHMRTWDMWQVCLQTFRSNRTCYKLAYFLRNLQTSRANNSRILTIKNAKFSGYCFYINTNLLGDFQICISVPLRDFLKLQCEAFSKNWT